MVVALGHHPALATTVLPTLRLAILVEQFERAVFKRPIFERYGALQEPVAVLDLLGLFRRAHLDEDGTLCEDVNQAFGRRRPDRDIEKDFVVRQRGEHDGHFFHVRNQRRLGRAG